MHTASHTFGGGGGDHYGSEEVKLFSCVFEGVELESRHIMSCAPSFKPCMGVKVQSVSFTGLKDLSSCLNFMF